MSAIRFYKYEGIGNDFILIDAERPALIDSARARRLCDRHFGIGADGVLVVTGAESDATRARMTILNADGSRAEMCGNGLRCVALHLALADGATEASYHVQTDAGPLACAVERDGELAQVRLQMGRGQLLGEHSATFAGDAHRFLLVSMGNPHAVRFGDPWSDADIDRFSPEVSAAFEAGTNVEFACVRTRHAIDLVVWERGVGRTLACGTGAAATVVAAASDGRVPFGEDVQVRLPGGPLTISVAPETLQVELRGAARRVFSGEVSA